MSQFHCKGQKFNSLYFFFNEKKSSDFSKFLPNSKESSRAEENEIVISQLPLLQKVQNIYYLWTNPVKKPTSLGTRKLILTPLIESCFVDT